MYDSYPALRTRKETGYLNETRGGRAINFSVLSEKKYCRTLEVFVLTRKDVVLLNPLKWRNNVWEVGSVVDLVRLPPDGVLALMDGVVVLLYNPTEGKDYARSDK